MCLCRDLVYLDLALDGAIRTTVEGALEQLRSAAKPGSTDQLPQLLQICAACAENACLSTGSNQELVLAFRDLQVNISSSCSQSGTCMSMMGKAACPGQPPGTGAGFQGRPAVFLVCRRLHRVMTGKAACMIMQPLPLVASLALLWPDW